MNVSCKRPQHCQVTKQKTERQIVHTKKHHIKFLRVMENPATLFSMSTKCLHIIKGTFRKHSYLGQRYLCHSFPLNFNNRTEDVIRSKHTLVMSIYCMT